MIGIDLVYLPEFKDKLKNLPIEKVFSQTELRENKTPESLASIFAAKEAFFKAIGRKENWLDVWVEKDKFGKPRIYSNFIEPSIKMELSIAHTNDYLVALIIIWKH